LWKFNRETTMTPHTHIGLDFDDTLMPTRTMIVAHLNKVYGKTIGLEELKNYYFGPEWGITGEDFERIFVEHEAAFHDCPPLPGVMETLSAWRKTRTFFVITGRPMEWLSSAREWLKRHGIPVERIHSAEHTVDKARIAKEEGITLFVEDNPRVANDLAEKGIDVILLDTPYNQECSHPRITRVKDWFEILGRPEKGE
jgi:uncharacterized HAD superfamily protein